MTDEMENNEQSELVYFGDSVKALGDGKLGGYLVRFSSDDDPDLAGEYFTKDTDFGEYESSPVFYNHALDPILKNRKLGKATLRVDEFGVWAETQLKNRDKYEQFILQMAKDGR